MFDKVTNIVSKRASVEALCSFITAPTDASVQLLKEMEQTAKDKLVASFTLDGNSLNGVVNIYQDMRHDSIVIEVTFDLNGKRINEVISIPKYKNTYIIEAVKNAVSKRITIELLANTFSQLDEHTARLIFK